MSAAVETQTAEQMSKQDADIAKVIELIGDDARAGKSEEEMIIPLITVAKLPLKKGMRLLNLALSKMNLKMTAKDRVEEVSTLLKRPDVNFGGASDWDEIEKLCRFISAEIENTSEREALVALKRFCKANSVDLPDRPKGRRGGIGKSYGLRLKVTDWMLENCTNDSVTEQDLIDYVYLEKGVSTDAEKVKYKVQANNFARQFTLARQIGAKMVENTKAA